MEYTKPEYDEVKRGEIYYIGVDEDSESVGSEQCNHDRPGIIVSNDVGNTHSGIVEVVYLTTAPKKDLPTHVDIYTTVKPSTALCEQICTISKHRLRKYVNQCTEREMEDIDSALQISLGLSKAKGVVKYMEKWNKMMEESKVTIDDVSATVQLTTTVQSIDEPIVECVNNTLAKVEAELELYKKFYEDTHELLKLAIGGNSYDTMGTTKN